MSNVIELSCQTVYIRTSAKCALRSQERGRTTWQKIICWIWWKDHKRLRLKVILSPYPMCMFWQASNLPWTISWFYLMLSCYLHPIECANNIIINSNMIWKQLLVFWNKNAAVSVARCMNSNTLLPDFVVY